MALPAMSTGRLPSQLYWPFQFDLSPVHWKVYPALKPALVPVPDGDLGHFGHISDLALFLLSPQRMEAMYIAAAATPMGLFLRPDPSRRPAAGPGYLTKHWTAGMREEYLSPQAK